MGYISIELDAGETCEPFFLPTLGGNVLRAVCDGALLVEARIGGLGSWTDLSSGLDLGAYEPDEQVSLQYRLTLDSTFVGHRVFPVFLGVVNVDPAGWLD